MSGNNKIIAWMQVSLDGRASGPDGAFDWPVVQGDLWTYFVEGLGEPGSSATEPRCISRWPPTGRRPTRSPVPIPGRSRARSCGSRCRSGYSPAAWSRGKRDEQRQRVQGCDVRQLAHTLDRSERERRHERQAQRHGRVPPARPAGRTSGAHRGRPRLRCGHTGKYHLEPRTRQAVDGSRPPIVQYAPQTCARPISKW